MKTRLKYLEVQERELEATKRLHVAKQLEGRVGLDKEQVHELAGQMARKYRIEPPPMELEKSKRELRAALAAEEDRKAEARAAGLDPCPKWTAPDREPKQKRRSQRWQKIKRIFSR